VRQPQASFVVLLTVASANSCTLARFGLKTTLSKFRLVKASIPLATRQARPRLSSGSVGTAVEDVAAFQRVFIPTDCSV
jgi:hypothetical protein